MNLLVSRPGRSKHYFSERENWRGKKQEKGSGFELVIHIFAMQSWRKSSINRDLRLWCLLTAGMESGKPHLSHDRTFQALKSDYMGCSSRQRHLWIRTPCPVLFPCLSFTPAEYFTQTSETIINSCSLSIKCITTRSIGKKTLKIWKNLKHYKVKVAG